MSTRVLAPAKVNLWLEVLGRRPDGYHELETALLAIDLCDVIEARAVERPGVRLALGGPFASADVPRDDSNLAVAAAQRVLHAAIAAGARERGLELALTKNVPSQAGLGGGSSDAAAALLAAERELGFELDPRAAESALGALGSDCVFFRAAAATGFARCTGRGERVEPLPAVGEHWRLAVIAPSIGAPTHAVYAELTRSLRKPAPASTLPARFFERSLPNARALLFNRLEDACLALLPELRCWRTLLDDVGASHFRLCGSGSSFFGLYDDASRARAELDAIERAAHAQGRGWRGSWVVAPLGAGARIVPAA